MKLVDWTALELSMRHDPLSLTPPLRRLAGVAAFFVAFACAAMPIQPMYAQEPPACPDPDPSDDPISIEVNVGDPFVVALPSNITTGYSWQYAGADPDGIVQPVGSEYVSLQTPGGISIPPIVGGGPPAGPGGGLPGGAPPGGPGGGLPGGAGIPPLGSGGSPAGAGGPPAGPAGPIAGLGGKECWAFQTVATGSTTLTMIYRRPFEPESVPPVKTKQIVVTVNEAP